MNKNYRIIDHGVIEKDGVKLILAVETDYGLELISKYDIDRFMRLPRRRDGLVDKRYREAREMMEMYEAISRDKWENNLI